MIGIINVNKLWLLLLMFKSYDWDYWCLVMIRIINVWKLWLGLLVFKSYDLYYKCLKVMIGIIDA